jgi:hypothetical protein
MPDRQPVDWRARALVLASYLRALADGPCPSRDRPGTVAARLCPESCVSCYARRALREAGMEVSDGE